MIILSTIIKRQNYLGLTHTNTYITYCNCSQNNTYRSTYGAHCCYHIQANSYLLLVDADVIFLFVSDIYWTTFNRITTLLPNTSRKLEEEILKLFIILHTSSYVIHLFISALRAYTKCNLLFLQTAH